MNKEKIITDAKLIKTLLILKGRKKDNLNFVEHCLPCPLCKFKVHLKHTKFRISENYIEACTEGCNDDCLDAAEKTNWHRVTSF